MTHKPFANQTALVTGAGVGIGYEIARRLALGGARVLLNDIDGALAAEAAANITAEGGVCHAADGDVADVLVVQSLVAQAVVDFGGLDMAVSNAGLTSWGDFFDYRPEDFDRVLAINLRGSFFLAQAAARQMREQGRGGRILLISSVTGHQAIRYVTAYAMTKAALEMMARSLVLELSPHNITINCVAPGATLTPRNLKDDPNYAQSWGQVTPLGRVAEPEDIARAALFFLSEAAAYITGQSLVVDGGWTATSPTPRLDFVEKKG